MTASSTPQRLLFVAAILATFFFSSLVEATCWCRQDGNIIDCSTTETACPNSSSVDGGAQLCCVTGDTCGEDSLCHFTKDIANTSGYYLGGCTDQSYNDPVCQGVCSEYYFEFSFAPRLRGGLWGCGGASACRQLTDALDRGWSHHRCRLQHKVGLMVLLCLPKQHRFVRKPPNRRIVQSYFTRPISIRRVI